MKGSQIYIRSEIYWFPLCFWRLSLALSRVRELNIFPSPSPVLLLTTLSCCSQNFHSADHRARGWEGKNGDWRDLAHWARKWTQVCKRTGFIRIAQAPLPFIDSLASAFSMYFLISVQLQFSHLSTLQPSCIYSPRAGSFHLIWEGFNISLAGYIY